LAIVEVVKKKALGKKTAKTKKKRFSYSYIGIIISVFIVVLLVSLPQSPAVLGASTARTQNTSIFSGISSFFSQIFKKITTGNSQTTSVTNTTSTTQTVLSANQLVAMADNMYADGNLPLGDNKYVTDSSKKGYIYLCSTQSNENGGGADTTGSWIHGTTWNIKEKLSVSGAVSWPTATFSDTVSGNTRTISGNDLPISHTTGIFPIQSSDKAYTYDKNPNSIAAQTITQQFPASPTYSNTAYCMGGEVGVMLTGVALFNGFDALHRDAAANEVQDGCQGHPQVSGEYHYHSLSSCITDVSVNTVIGFALDGFPITGPKVATDKYLTTDDLDDCHGITSEIVLDGVKKTMYHYVMTQDFPYSVSCFRAKPVSLMLTASTQSGNSSKGQSMQKPSGMPSQSMQQGGQQRRQPPQQAISACSGKASGSSCQFTTPRETISGTCKMPPSESTLVCVPSGIHARQ
jgi:hypothetical protein